MKNESGGNNNNFGSNAPRRPKDLIGAKIGEYLGYFSNSFFAFFSLRERIKSAISSL
jgi:hypothetical protein